MREEKIRKLERDMELLLKEIGVQGDKTSYLITQLKKKSKEYRAITGENYGLKQR